MDFLKTVFPLSFRPIDTKAFIVTLLIYGLIGLISGAMIGFLSRLWIIGWIFSLIGAVAELYVLVGVILTVLSFTQVLK